MQLVKEFTNQLDFGFDLPEPGVSLCQIVEGIKYVEREDGKHKLLVPLVIVKNIKGPESNVGLRLSRFVSATTPAGEKELSNYLYWNGLFDKFAERFPGRFSPEDSSFLLGLNKTLPGRMLEVAHNIQQWNGKDQVNIISIKHGGQPGQAAQQAGQAPPVAPPVAPPITPAAPAPAAAPAQAPAPTDVDW